MKTWLRLSGAAIALAVSAFRATAQEPERPVDQETAVRVFGTVIDHRTRQPIPLAGIVLRPENGEDVIRRAADEEGRFGFPLLPAGSYAIEIQALGYHAIRETVPIRRVAEVQVTVEMIPVALELDAVVVVTERRGRLDLAGFNDRRQSGFGRYLTREDIERRNPLYVSDLLRTVPGVRVVPGGFGSGNEVRLRGGCRPTVFIDGLRVAAIEGFGIDDLLMAYDIEGIEVYQGIQTPVQFQGGSCGSIVVWTRMGQAGPGRGSFWTRLAIGVGLLGLGFLLTR